MQMSVRILKAKYRASQLHYLLNLGVLRRRHKFRPENHNFMISGINKAFGSRFDHFRVQKSLRGP
jgi:hypothetical protein